MERVALPHVRGDHGSDRHPAGCSCGRGPLFAWLPPYRVLMVWVYDRTESLLIAMLMHVPISVTAFVLASEATSSTALVAPVLIWGAALWLIVAVVAWANGGTLTRRQEPAARKACRSDARRAGCPPRCGAGVQVAAVERTPRLSTYQ